MTSYNTNKKLTEKQEKKLAEKYTKTKGFIKNIWWYFSLWYNETCDFWEKELKIKLNKYLISTKTDDIITVLDKNISVAIGLKVSKEILKSMRDDGILQDEDVKGKVKYWHLARIKKTWTLYDISIIDNYSGTGKHNRYELEELKEFLKSEYVFENCRFVLSKDINKEIPSSQYAIQKLWLRNERLNDSITRFEVFSVVGSLIRYLERK